MDARGWEPCVRPPQTVGNRANNGRTHQGNGRSTIASMGTRAAAEAGKHRFLLRCAATHAQISNGLAQRERGSPLGGIRGPVRALAERDSTTAIVRIGDASSSPRATTDSHQWTGSRSEQPPTGARSHWQVTACVGNTAPPGGGRAYLGPRCPAEDFGATVAYKVVSWPKTRDEAPANQCPIIRELI